MRFRELPRPPLFGLNGHCFSPSRNSRLFATIPRRRGRRSVSRHRRRDRRSAGHVSNLGQGLAGADAPTRRTQAAIAAAQYTRLPAAGVIQASMGGNHIKQCYPCCSQHLNRNRQKSAPPHARSLAGESRFPVEHVDGDTDREDRSPYPGFVFSTRSSRCRRRPVSQRPRRSLSGHRSPRPKRGG